MGRKLAVSEGSCGCASQAFTEVFTPSTSLIKGEKKKRDGGLDIKKIQTVYFRAEFPVTTSLRFLFIHFLHFVSVDPGRSKV